MKILLPLINRSVARPARPPGTRTVFGTDKSNFYQILQINLESFRLLG